MLSVKYKNEAIYVPISQTLYVSSSENWNVVGFVVGVINTKLPAAWEWIE